jgi:hypothetical protein
MKTFLKLGTAAAVLAGAAALSTPASAAWVGVGVGPIGFDVYSGGYCDRWGCPSEYWGYPVYYGPVYYGSAWYRGPVYYRSVGAERWYWIHGAWHRDQWRGPRPAWARNYHYGPALGLDYYRAHGFRVRDEDWRAWHDRDRYRYRTDYYRDRDDYRAGDRDRGYDHDYDRERGTYGRSGYDRDQHRDYDRDNSRGTMHTRYDRDQDRMRSDRDRMRPDDQTRDHGNPGASDRDRSGSENGYEKTKYEQQPGMHGHAKPPPVTSHSSSKQKSNPDEDNGPSD